jgi:hypothetical protein
VRAPDAVMRALLATLCDVLSGPAESTAEAERRTAEIMARIRRDTRRRPGT